MAPQEEVIDLCGSSDSEQAPRPSKRQRLAGFNIGDYQLDSDDEVQVIEPKREQQQRQQEPEETLDDDLAVLEERGAVWNKNLPHTRDLCGEKAFSKTTCADNAAHCANCYCYVCDVKASACAQWGDGSASYHHCHGHAGSPFHQALRRSRNANPAAAAAAAAAAAPRPEPANALARFTQQIIDPLRGLVGRPLSGGARPAKPAAAVAAPCRLKRIPDPTGDRDMMLLARLELKVKAQGDRTIAGLRKRLAPTGFYLPLRDEGASQYGDRLCLENLFDTSWDGRTNSFQPTRLKLCKMRLPEREAEPTAMRTRQVTILHFDGRAPPTVYGVSVHKKSTVRDLKRAAAPLAGLDAAREVLVAVNLNNSQLSCAFLEDKHEVTDANAADRRIGLWRLPKPTEGTAGPNYAVIFHRKSANTEYPAWEAAGMPTLLPLGRQFASGGKTAERAVVERLLTALGSLRRQPGGNAAGGAEGGDEGPSGSGAGAGVQAPKPEQEAKRLLAAGLKLVRSSPHGCLYYVGADRQSEFATSKPYNTTMQYGETFFKDGFLFLRIDWTADRLGDWDTKAWLHPRVDASASPAAMQATVDIMKANAEWDAIKRRAQQLPRTMLDELKAASRCLEPGVPYPAVRRYYSEPMARVVLDLVPATNGSAEKKGKAVISVYVWRGERGSPHRQFFMPHDTWDSARSSRREFQGLGEHPLQSTMEVMLWSDPAHVQRKEEIKEWRDKEAAHSRSIPGLMKMLERGEMPAAVQPGGLNVEMRPYQKQSLQFMLDCERGEGGFRRIFWQRLTTPGGEHYWWSALLGRASTDVPPQNWGGWCCEEMGLGKTIEVLGLILANPGPAMAPGVHKDGQGLIKSRATLVVCAVSLVGQWIAEAQAKLSRGKLRIHMYHGPNRIRDPARLATEFDLVVTTYATLGADYGGKKTGGQKPNFPPLGAIKWHRLVLDEAHTVKNAAVAHTKACSALQADRRWMCTGTPINTDVADLYGQFVVLGMSPFNNKTMFDSYVKSAYGNAYGAGCAALVYTLGKTMIRHTKKQVLGGEEVLRLPPKTEELVAVVLTAEEQEMYKKAHATSAALFAQYKAMGNATINKHLLQIMALLLPMRRVCSGGNLKPRDLAVNDPLFGEGAALRQRRLDAGGAGGLGPADQSLVAPDEECPICIDVLEQPTQTPCHHWFCRECILGVLYANAKCPLCRRLFALPELRQGITAAEADALEAEAEAAKAAAGGDKGKGKEGAGEGGEGGDGEAAAVPPPEPALVSESKLQALLKELRAMRRQDPTAKALIFSQYVSTIEWLKTRLTQAGFGYRFISGSMALKTRAKAIRQFQEDPPTTVFLLSMRSGSVGINLTAASHVFLMEPALNPALEEQAIGRAWRMGQKNEVRVVKFYVKGSVEERIMDVVKSRTHHAAGANAADGQGGAASEDDSDDEDFGAGGYGRGRGRRRYGGGGRTNVRMQDLVGSINADRQQLRVDELDTLFKDPDFPEPRVPQEESESEDDEADAAAAAAALAAAAPRDGGAAASRGGTGARRGRKPGAAAGRRRQRSGDSEEEEDDEDEAFQAAIGRGARAALGRGARTRKLPVRNYAELAGSTEDSDEELEEEEAEPSPAARRGAAAAAAAAGRRGASVGRSAGGAGAGGKRKRRGSAGAGEEDSEEEYRPEEDGEDEASPSLDLSPGASEDDEDYADDRSPTGSSLPWGRAKSKGKQPARGRRSASAAPAQQQQQQQQMEGQQQQQQKEQQKGSRIRQITTVTIPARPVGQQQQQKQQQQEGAGPGSAPSSRPGSAGGRLSSGWMAAPAVAAPDVAGAPAANGAAVPGAAAAAGAATGATPRVSRGPMRGARLPAALAAHLQPGGGSAGRPPAPAAGGAAPMEQG